jgi:glycosyltransferase involved in cell wall biosynthesis
MTAGMASSGVASRTTSAATMAARTFDARARFLKPPRAGIACGEPAPMARAAARDVARERVTTAPIRQPRACRRFARVLPTRPAPTIERVRAIERASITCPIESGGGNSRLHLFLTIALGLAAFLWVVEAIAIAAGVWSIPALASTPPLADAECPTVSILFAARDEAEKLPGALATFLSLDYPRYEVIAIDDRSEDATGAILDGAAGKDDRLKALHLSSLPQGWLGKAHALQKAYEQSKGEWLVLTDADVHFAPDLLRRSIGLAKEKGWDHLTLLAEAKTVTAGEKVVMAFFAMAFLIGSHPWDAQDPSSPSYSGVGAFQLIRRSTYQGIGTHKRLAMEVVDDMKVGKLVKKAGLRSGVARGGRAVSVHWHAGVGNIVRGTTKNFFATAEFKLWRAAGQIGAVLYLCVLPAAAFAFLHGTARAFAGVAAATPVLIESGVAWESGIPIVYALTYPLGAFIFAWMLARSTAVTLWQGGIVWRGTFYSLAELRRGLV